MACCLWLECMNKLSDIAQTLRDATRRLVEIILAILEKFSKMFL